MFDHIKIKISEAQNLLSEFRIRLHNTQIASTIDCEMVLKYHIAEWMILHAVTNDVSPKSIFLVDWRST